MVSKGKRGGKAYGSLCATRRNRDETHASPKIHALMPMSAPTTAPTHLSLPELTRPRLRLSLETAHCSANDGPNEKETSGGVAQG